MIEEINRLLGSVLVLINSCSENDITTDIFVRPADPTQYRAALEDITDRIATLRASGLNRDEVTRLVTSPGCDFPDGLKEITPAGQLASLMGGGFTPPQRSLVRTILREWASVIFSDDPENGLALLEERTQPLALDSLLSPAVTHMKRFNTVMLLQMGHQMQYPLERPPWETGENILVAFHDAPEFFCSRLNLAVFWFLAARGHLKVPVFKYTVLQALHDVGVFRGGGENALVRMYRDDDVLSPGLSEAGRQLAGRLERLYDIRELFETALTCGSGPADVLCRNRSQPACSLPLTTMEKRAGQVLGGFASIAAHSSSSMGLDTIIAFSEQIASRMAGQAEPGPLQIQAVDEVILECLHLLRVLTGDYRWRAVPFPDEDDHYRPLVSLSPDLARMQYDKEKLAYRHPAATRALVVEALYRNLFITMPGHDTKTSRMDAWFNVLVSMVCSRRAVMKGREMHPGVWRWFERLIEEETSPANILAQEACMELVHPVYQFLEGVVFEGRTGGVCGYVRDPAVVQALERTRDARRKAGSPACDPEGGIATVRNEVWPVFQYLVSVSSTRVNKSGFLGEKGELGQGTLLEPQGSVPRVDTSVRSPDQPSGDTEGVVIEGNGPGLLEDDGLSIPGFSDITGLPGSDRLGISGNPAGRHQGGDPGSGSLPKTGPVDEDLFSGMYQDTEELEDACNASRNLMDHLPVDPDDYDQIRSGGAGISGSLKDTMSTLGKLAEKMDETARALEHKVQSMLGGEKGYGNSLMNDGIQQGAAPGDKWNAACRVSEKVTHAAREYRNSLSDLERDVHSSGTDPGNIIERIGMTRKALDDLEKAGTEFRQVTAPAGLTGPGRENGITRLPDPEEGQETGSIPPSGRTGRIEPSFIPGADYNQELWESLSYFDDSFGEDCIEELNGPSGGRNSQHFAEKRYEQGETALTREAELYLSSLRQRTRSEWETLEEKAERIRTIALLETHSVGQDDYTLYQRFYQPVAGLIGVARKNIQQALQKNRPTHDLTELITGDDIDEENLAAVRTTMRIFKDTGKQPDKTRWNLSLLIDASSSMHDETVAKKLEATIQCALLFGEAVNRISGISFEIAAFADVEYIPLKRYQDGWSIHQGCYLIRQVIQASGGTNDVGAVGSALERMNRLRSDAGTNRMIFVISDGQSGVGGRDPLREVFSLNRETRIFGWGIGPDMEEIEETYRPYGTWVPDIADLPRSMGEVLRRELSHPALTAWKKDHTTRGQDQETEEDKKICSN